MKIIKWLKEKVFYSRWKNVRLEHKTISVVIDFETFYGPVYRKESGTEVVQEHVKTGKRRIIWIPD